MQSDEVEHTITGNNELRVTVNWPKSATESDVIATIELTDGAAEIFGTRLVPNRRYPLTGGVKFAINVAEGSASATVKCRGSLNVSESEPSITRAHYQQLYSDIFESSQATQPPIVMVIGPTDSGKSTLCKYLIAHAERNQFQPRYFVDLDMGQSTISIPGTIAFAKVGPASEQNITRGFSIAASEKRVYFLGNVSLTNHYYGTFKTLCDKMGSDLRQEINNEKSESSSDHQHAVIINTFGWVEALGYRGLRCAIKGFQVNHIVVLGPENERLVSKLHRDFGERIENGKMRLHTSLPQNRSIAPRTTAYRRRTRSNVLQAFFYPSITHTESHEMMKKGSSAESELETHTLPISGLTVLEFKAKEQQPPPKAANKNAEQSSSTSQSSTNESEANEQSEMFGLAPDDLPEIMCRTVPVTSKLKKVIFAIPSLQQTTPADAQSTSQHHVDIMKSQLIGFATISNIDTENNTVTIAMHPISHRHRETLPVTDATRITLIAGTVVFD